LYLKIRRRLQAQIRSSTGIRTTSRLLNGALPRRIGASTGARITAVTSWSSASAAAWEYVTKGMLTVSGLQSEASSRMRIRLIARLLATRRRARHGCGG